MDAPMKTNQSQGRLLVLYGRDAGRVVKLSRAPVTIGRAPGNRIVIDNAFVSRQHAQITFRLGQYWLEPLGNRNGTFLNTRCVSKPTRLHDQQIIRVAHLPVLRFKQAAR